MCWDVSNSAEPVLCILCSWWFYQWPWILFNLRVASTAMQAEQAPMKRHTAIAFGPSVEFCSSFGASLSSGLLPGSNIENTTHDMPVPTNCGRVVYKFIMPRYFPELSPVGLLASSRLWFRESGIGDSNSMEERCPRRPYVWLFDKERRLISTPRKANGAQQATDQDLDRVSVYFVEL